MSSAVGSGAETLAPIAPNVEAVDTQSGTPAGSDHPKIRFRADIEGLRAVAILLVLLDHLKVPGFRGGFIGVDVFFVISGFLITSLLAVEQEGKAGGKRHMLPIGRTVMRSISIRGFYERRARRILPASLAVIAFTLIVSKFLFNDLRFAEVQTDALWATLFAANIHLMSQATDYFAQGVALSPLQNYWSLAVEEQFYFVWPVLFIIATKLEFASPVREQRTSWRSRVFAAVVILGGISLAWSIIATAQNPGPAYFSPFTRAWELAVGAAVALAFHNRRGLDQTKSTIAGATGFVLVLLGLVLISPDTEFPGFMAILPVAGAALLLTAGINHAATTPTGRLLSTTPARFIGRISYSLYLWHWPIIVFAASIVSTRTFGGAPRWITLAAISIAVSWLSYHLIENPFRRLRLKGTVLDVRGRWMGSGRDALRLGAMAISALVVVGTIISYSRPAPSNEALKLAADQDLSKWASWDGSSAVAGPALADKAAWLKALEAGAKQVNASPSELARAKGSKALAPNTDCFNVTSLSRAKSCGITGRGGAGLEWPDGLAKTVVLVGNSQAAQWREAIASALPTDVRIVPITLTSCEPWWPASNHTKTANGDDCGTHIRFVDQALSKLKPGLIMFGGLATGEPSDWASLSKRLSRVQRNVLQIGTAAYVHDFSKCLGSGSNIRACNGPAYKGELARDKTLRDAVTATGTKYFSTAGVLCWRGTCPAIVDGSPTHTDGRHLTASTMTGIASFLADSIAEAVGAKIRSSGP